MPNAELARKILDAIENSPDNFDMDSWFNGRDSLVLTPDTTPECGTTMCVAGWAAYLTGWTVMSAGYARKGGGGLKSIGHIGELALELTEDQSDDLFFASDKDAVEILNHIATTGEYPPITD